MTETATSLPIEIRHRWEDRVIYRSTTATTVCQAAVEAISAGANLAWANLAGANLDGANLDGANLAGANLAWANLAGANLAGANLDGANLDGAKLAGAKLAGANLDGANLDGAKLAASELAFAGPVGNARRIVYGFLAQTDEAHPAPWLVLTCGCFTGDEAGYRARIEKYATAGDCADKRHHAECIAALESIKSMAALWPGLAVAPKPKRKPAAKKARKAKV